MARRIDKFNSEVQTHERIVRFLKRDHPGVVFKTDFSAGLKLPIWLATRQRKLQYKRGFPDLFIYKPIKTADSFYCGLALEIKKPGIRLKKADGSWANDHFREQADMLSELSKHHYAGAFAIGYDEAVDIIECYLAARPLPTVDFMVVGRSGPTMVHEQEVVF